jgi:hypothetical protein
LIAQFIIVDRIIPTYVPMTQKPLTFCSVTPTNAEAVTIDWPASIKPQT